MNEQILHNNFEPLRKVVNAAIIDTWEDKGKVEQVFTHWAARGLKELNAHILRTGIRRVFLHVNQNTKTAALPIDFDGETFVGYLDHRGYKVSLYTDSRIVNMAAIEDIPCEDKCPKCQSDTSICNDLSVTTETVTVVINGVNYEQTITKKLYPNGDYFLETSIPYADTSDTVIYRTSKSLITHLDLNDCGCVAQTDANIQAIKVCNPEVYCNHFAPMERCHDRDHGGYEIFEDIGLIQLSHKFQFTKVYMEYRPSMVKINGQYQVPKVAFEALVEWIKYKSIQNKTSVSRGDKNDQWNHYIIAKSNMEKVKWRVSLNSILHGALKVPKFDYYFENVSYCGSKRIMDIPTPAPADDNNTPQQNTAAVTKGYVPYSFGVIAGLPAAPVDQSDEWQYDHLIDGINLTSIIVQDTTYTAAKGDFSFDPNSGKIRLLKGNKFYQGDVVVGNYFKLV